MHKNSSLVVCVNGKHPRFPSSQGQSTHVILSAGLPKMPPSRSPPHRKNPKQKAPENILISHRSLKDLDIFSSLSSTMVVTESSAFFFI